MAKKAVIVITLVDESEEKSNEELEKEIFDELSGQPVKIPWMKNVEKVSIIEDPLNHLEFSLRFFGDISVQGALPLLAKFKN